MKNPCELSLVHYAPRTIKLNEYFAALPIGKLSEKIGDTELNKILLISVPNIWSKKVYVKRFDCETITLKIHKCF